MNDLSTLSGIIVPADDGRNLTLDRQGKDTFIFLCMLIWPFIDVYWITVSALSALQPDHIMEESQLCRFAARRAEALYYAGYIDFYEAISTDAIKNALSWCANTGVLTYKHVEVGALLPLSWV